MEIFWSLDYDNVPTGRKVLNYKFESKDAQKTENVPNSCWVVHLDFSMGRSWSPS